MIPVSLTVKYQTITKSKFVLYLCQATDIKLGYSKTHLSFSFIGGSLAVDCRLTLFMVLAAIPTGPDRRLETIVDGEFVFLSCLSP